MVKNNETDVKTEKQVAKEQPRSSGRVSRIVTLAAVAALFGGAGWFLYQNPQFMKMEQKSPQADEQWVVMQNKINALQQQLAVLEADNAGKISGREISALNERIDAHARINRELLDSKAGNNAILGLINRVDMLETRVNNLGKVSSSGALILTAAMLVKDSAETGRSFEYEAEVLRQLAEGTNMQQPAEVIAAYAAEGLPDRQQLIAEFDEIYQETHMWKTSVPETAEAETTPEQADWKDKINEKLSKLISVKYHNAEGKIVEQTIDEDEVYILVNDGQFDQAVLKMVKDPQYQTEAFQNWQKRIRARDEFDQALRRIQALTLAAMKVENLQSQAQ